MLNFCGFGLKIRLGGWSIGSKREINEVSESGNRVIAYDRAVHS